MRYLYLDTCCGLNIIEMPGGGIFLHHLLQNILIGPLQSEADAQAYIALNPALERLRSLN